MSVRLYIYNTIASLLPETRLYPLKAVLLRLSGYNIARSARIVSSVRYYGSFSLSVGGDTYIGHDVLIAGGDCTISIGNACDLAPRVNLVAGSHEVDMNGAHTAGSGYSRDIVIEEGVWIGTGTTVLGGVRIGRKAIIAAGAVVTSDIPSLSMAAGVPARVMKTWNSKEQCWIVTGDPQNADTV